jgi:hypothetical protein
MKTIEITVNPLGQTRIETKGFSGSECIEATRELERALGVTRKDQRTAEFYSQANASNHNSVNQVGNSEINVSG